MSRDPLKYFRIEARELLAGLAAGVREISGGAERATVVTRMLRLAHTLKGAARVVRQPDLANRAHALEDLLAPWREPGPPPGADELRAWQAEIDEATDRLVQLDVPPGERKGQAAPAEVAQFDTVRVELAELDGLLEPLEQALVHLSSYMREIKRLTEVSDLAAAVRDLRDPGAPALSRQLTELLQPLHHRLTERADSARLDLEEALAGVHRMRLVPIASILPQLERAVADAAEQTGRSAILEASGGDVRLDAPVLLAARDALLHVVRNAVAHGVEAPEQRAAAGKPLRATVSLSVQRQGRHVKFVCSDDGQGLDLSAIRNAAVVGGKLAPGTPLALGEAALLLLQGGVSTAKSVTGLAGRGVGLDVVRATADRHRGSVQVRSVARQGVTVELTLPISMSSVDALAIACDGKTTMLPLDAVERILHFGAHDLITMGDGPALVVGDEALPFMALEPLLGLPEPARTPPWTAVVLSSQGKRLVLGVAKVLGTARVTVRALPAVIGPMPLVAGAVLDADGMPQLVLDPLAVLEAATRMPGRPLPVVRALALPPLLVIDDSLTTRMLEQSILEAAGYVVDTAVSAEQGLAMAARRTYGVFVVDVEMPGMNGFEFVAQTRADPVLGRVPAILVTSCNTAEDRARGLAAGAHHYIVKGEFDQGVLLRSIRNLLGQR